MAGKTGHPAWVRNDEQMLRRSPFVWKTENTIIPCFCFGFTFSRSLTHKYSRMWSKCCINNRICHGSTKASLMLSLARSEGRYLSFSFSLPHRIIRASGNEEERKCNAGAILPKPQKQFKCSFSPSFECMVMKFSVTTQNGLMLGCASCYAIALRIHQMRGWWREEKVKNSSIDL